jgi:HEAT repeat protein
MGTDIRDLLKECSSGSDRAIEVLAAYCLSTSDGVGILLTALEENDESIRHGAAKVLAELKDSTPKTILALKRAARRDKAELVRLEALTALTNVTDDEKELVPLMLSALNDDRSESVRKRAAYLFRTIAPGTDDVVNGLKRALLDKEPDVRIQAAHAIVRNSEGSKSILLIIEAFRKSDESTLSRLASAASSVDETGILPLCKALYHEDKNARAGALFTLGMMYRSTSRDQINSAYPKILKLVGDKEAIVRKAAVRAVGNLDRKDLETVTLLIGAIDDQEEEVRLNTADALGRLDGVSDGVVPALIKLLQDSKSGVRQQAAIALGRMGANAKLAIPALCLALEDTSEGVCLFAADALGHIGPEAKSAIPALMKAKKSESEDVRKRATEALKKINNE